jgi:hypothetical protein
MNGGAESRCFCCFEPNYGQTKNIGNDLAHTGTLGAASRNAQFLGFDPKSSEAVHSLSQSDYDSFD